VVSYLNCRVYVPVEFVVGSVISHTSNNGKKSCRNPRCTVFESMTMNNSRDKCFGNPKSYDRGDGRYRNEDHKHAPCLSRQSNTDWMFCVQRKVCLIRMPIGLTSHWMIRGENDQVIEQYFKLDMFVKELLHFRRAHCPGRNRYFEKLPILEVIWEIGAMCDIQVGSLSHLR
jgi:hypothetical protein